MKLNIVKAISIAGLLLISQLAQAAPPVIDTFVVGQPLTAAQMNTIKALLEANLSSINDIQSEPDIPFGADDGDLLYWHGSEWRLTPAPPVTAWIIDPSLYFCGGVPTWSTSGCTVYAIGDTGPAGGIVFYVINGGYSGLEASLTDQTASVAWGCSGISIPDAAGTAIGTGRQNTTAIMSGCAESPIAARVADEFTFGGASDWYLPSLDELNEMYVNRGVVGGLGSGYYWSSSQAHAGYDDKAWFQEITYWLTGLQFSDGKESLLRVRAVRAF
jgi:hypothetical protein